MTFFWGGICQQLRKIISAQIHTLCSQLARSGPHVVNPSCYMNARTVFSIMVTRLPQTQELHTSGLNTPVVTRQGLLSGLKQGTQKCHSGTNHWNI